MADITKIISDEWRNTVSEETKKKYKTQYEQKKVKYLEKMALHIEAYGKPIKKKKNKKDKKLKKGKKFTAAFAKKVVNSKVQASKAAQNNAPATDNLGLE